MTYDDEARRYAEFLGSRLREECRNSKSRNKSWQIGSV
mgnify:CR=1 FL=1